MGPGRLAAAVAIALAAVGVPYAVSAVPPPPPVPTCFDPVVPCPAPTASPTPSPTPTPTPTPKPKPAKPDPIAYKGLGTWVDAYDFSREYRGRLTPAAVDEMARQKVKTLYIQAAKDRDGTGEAALLSQDVLGQFLERAHAKGIRVVAWYLPRFVDTREDWRHLNAIFAFRSHGHRFDSVGLDIESREVGDVKTRNDRLVAMSTQLRSKAGSMALSAIVVPPVVTDVINPKFWPNFPWSRIKASYDVWVPMAYYTNRKPESGYRDAYRYTTENVRLLRKNLDDQSALVHVAGGIGNESSSKDFDNFSRGARDARAMGSSCYDFATTGSGAWMFLRRGPS